MTPLINDAKEFLSFALKYIHLLPACVPQNKRSEHERLKQSFLQHDPQLPRWHYTLSRSAHLYLELENKLLHFAENLDKKSESSPHRNELLSMYSARMRELALESQLCRELGTSFFSQSSEKRFSPHELTKERAAVLATAWIKKKDEDPSPLHLSHLHKPGSLRSHIGALLSRYGIDYDIYICANMNTLSATGASCIYIAEAKWVSENRAKNIALHEVLGHVLPRHRAKQNLLSLYEQGSAKGNDTQEGYALSVEAQHGTLDDRRKHELAKRHLSVLAMRDGADPVQIIRYLMRLGSSLDDAIELTERIFRGSSGQTAGLGRERIYLEYFMAIDDAKRSHPEIESLLAQGLLGVNEAITLQNLCFTPEAEAIPVE